VQGKPWEKKKNQASAFYYTGTVFDMHKLLPTKKVMHNLKARKKFHALESYPTLHPSVIWSCEGEAGLARQSSTREVGAQSATTGAEARASKTSPNSESAITQKKIVGIFSFSDSPQLINVTGPLVLF